jgi:hypothetical protein
MSAKPKKKNLVKINYAALPTFKVDADQNWAELKSLPIHDRREQAISILHFLIQIHEIDLPEKIKNRFLKFYCAPDAIKARDVAFSGLTFANHEKESVMIDCAQDFLARRDHGKFKDDQNEGLFALAPIALQFAEIIEKRDVPALRRIIAIIESKGAPDGSRGGIGSEDGYMLEKFADLYLATRSLPTKKALRDACGLGKRADEKMASKRIDKLGLKGLPTEPEI